MDSSHTQPPRRSKPQDLHQVGRPATISWYQERGRGEGEFTRYVHGLYIIVLSFLKTAGSSHKMVFEIYIFAGRTPSGRSPAAYSPQAGWGDPGRLFRCWCRTLRWPPGMEWSTFLRAPIPSRGKFAFLSPSQFYSRAELPASACSRYCSWSLPLGKLAGICLMCWKLPEKTSRCQCWTRIKRLRSAWATPPAKIHTAPHLKRVRARRGSWSESYFLCCSHSD